MHSFIRTLSLTALLAAVCAPGFAQTAPEEPAQAAPVAKAAADAQVPADAQAAPVTAAPAAAQDATPAAPAVSPAVQALLAFKDSDVKFSVDELMDILADKRHEGWVLAAYPDPKTSQPLIGAGFSLDLPAREHPQPDALNPNLFYELSSADLWQAAGLDPARLTQILGEFNEQLSQKTAREFRRNLSDLAPQITEQDAMRLLRIGIVQSILNARAYCRNFDALTASQQMAVTQLVYQMGVNLEEFTQFLALINHDESRLDSDAEPSLREAVLRKAPGTSVAYWRSVQMSLAKSQWARLYRTRAVAVIAMFDPRYEANPRAAERRISAVVRPIRHRARHRTSSAELVTGRSTHHHAGHGRRKHGSRKETA